MSAISADPNQAPRGAPDAADAPEPAFTRRERTSLLDRFALFITSAVGSIGFFLIVFGWTVTWLAWNSLGPHRLRFDPFPGFVLLLFICNMIQLFLMPLIMVGQNIQARSADRRAEADLAVNRKAEEEVRAIRAQLDRLERMVEALRAE